MYNKDVGMHTQNLNGIKKNFFHSFTFVQNSTYQIHPI